MSTTVTRTAGAPGHPGHPARPSGPRVAATAESAVQRAADASVWLLFRLHGVRS